MSETESDLIIRTARLEAFLNDTYTPMVRSVVTAVMCSNCTLKRRDHSFHIYDSNDASSYRFPSLLSVMAHLEAMALHFYENAAPCDAGEMLQTYDMAREVHAFLRLQFAKVDELRAARQAAKAE
jgi:hypothetical protein